MGFDPASLSLALTALFLAPLINDLSGGRIGNALSQRGFKSNYQLSLDKYNKEQKLNKDSFNRSQSFANINRRLRGGGSGRSVTTRDGVLSFLGDPSRRLDDAPDIVEQNQSVLRGVETLGGFPLPNTQVPDIDNQRIIDSGFLGVRSEIDKINRNIDAIAAALAQSAGFEEKYRKDMIAAMRRDLVEKGKDRSETRSERSIFNLITRPIEQTQKIVGSLADGLRNALLLSIGLEAGAGLADAFGFGDEGGGDDEGGEESDDTSNTGPKVGDYYFVKDGRGGKYYILQSNGNFKKVNRKPTTGNQFSKSDFSPVIENIKQNNTPPPPGSGEEEGGNIDGKETSFLNLNTSVGGDSNELINNMFNPSKTIAMDTSGLQGRDRFTFIDLTTKNEKGNLDAQNASAGSTLDDSILDGDPSRGPGYEVFLSGATV